MVVGSQRADIALPITDETVFDEGLGDVIEHKGLLRKSLDELNGDGNMPRVEQQIIAKAVSLKRRQPAQEVATEHEAVVGFVVHDVADADQARVRGIALQLHLDVIGAHVQPADHAANPIVFVRQLQQEVGLLRDLARLHGHGAIDVGRGEQRLHVGWHVIDLQRAAVAGHPGVICGVVAPKMLMRINATGHRLLLYLRHRPANCSA